jgi:hypothetical protein
MRLPVTRRNFLGASSVFGVDAAFLCGVDIVFDIAIAEAKEFAADAQIIERWMNQWIASQTQGRTHFSQSQCRSGL